MGGMCLSMLLTMGLSMVVFFTLFSSLRSYGEQKLYNSYAELDKTYIETVASDEYITAFSAEEKDNILTIAIKDKYSEIEVMRCIQIGLLCVQQNPDARPLMATIVSYLSSHFIGLPYHKNLHFSCMIA